jgi:Soluble lytic murein transglycosylase and related regulatory proteins (some contain LysM/invasin domains)
MPKRQQSWSEGLTARPAQESHRRRRGKRKRIQPQRAIGLLLGAALSVGGVSQAFDDVRFVVKKDLYRMQVVREDHDSEKVVAGVESAFTASSIYKTARLFPGRYVTERSNLFGDHFLQRRDVSETANLADDFSLIDDEIRRQFFSSAIPFGEIIHEKAQKYDVDPALVAAVVEAESKFRHKAHSGAGAMGLMQLMPRTGRLMGARNLYDPDQNVDAGVKYLKYLELRFDGNLKKTIAAYNAGEGTVRRYDGVPPYRETRTYVKRVMRNYQKRKSQIADLAATPDGAPVETADASMMPRAR